MEIWQNEKTYWRPLKCNLWNDIYFLSIQSITKTEGSSTSFQSNVLVTHQGCVFDPLMWQNKDSGAKFVQAGSCSIATSCSIHHDMLSLHQHTHRPKCPIQFVRLTCTWTPSECCWGCCSVAQNKTLHPIMFQPPLNLHILQNPIWR